MPEGTPTSIVLSLRAQGLTNNQIIQNLQREGYSAKQISDAMSQADLRANIEGVSTVGAISEYPEATEVREEAPQMGATTGQELSPETIQALIEAVIEEKWEDLVSRVSLIIDWKDKIEQRMTSLEQQLVDLKELVDKIHSAVLEKVGEYETTMQDVATELKALEKVFSKILPGFMENVSELSRITKEMKEAKKK